MTIRRPRIVAPNNAILRLLGTTTKGTGMAAFVRRKRVGNYEYYQLVQSRRVDNEPRQTVLVHLGQHPTVDDALKKWPREIKKLKQRAATERESAETRPETSRQHQDMINRATSAEKRADSLAASLKKLRNLRKRGIA